MCKKTYHNMDLIRRYTRQSMVQQFLLTDLGHNMVPWPMTNPQELCNDSLSSKTKYNKYMYHVVKGTEDKCTT